MKSQSNNKQGLSITNLTELIPSHQVRNTFLLLRRVLPNFLNFRCLNLSKTSQSFVYVFPRFQTNLIKFHSF